MYNSQAPTLQFIRLQKTVFRLALSESFKETSLDVELALSADSISRADCKVPPDLRIRARLVRPESTLINLSLSSFNHILCSIESVSIMSYFKVNFAFIIIDFINKNKLFTYAFGLNPHKTQFTTDLNVFVTSNNYLENDALLSSALGLTSQARAHEFAAIRAHSGHQINEHLFEEVELVDFVDLIVLLAMLLSRGLYALATWFIRKSALHLGPDSSKRLTQE